MTSAKMRMMMQGIVTEGTGKKAALNGYTSAGKTGTAEKVDPATHTYSHTKLVASFAGFAPVSSPAISIAVVIDTPTAGGEDMHYGGAASAPVFADVAQQVLEYLGVPHDQPLKSTKQIEQERASVTPEDGPSDDNGTDINAMFADVNSLPPDDPLRQPQNAAAVAANQVADAAAAEAALKAQQQNEAHSKGVMGLPDKVLAAFHANGNTTSVMSTADATVDSVHVPVIVPAVARRSATSVVVDAGSRVAVPDFRGTALRNVVEHADSLGLRVQMLGSGLAREQAPAAGTMVPPGTEIVVRFAR
jgi:cell division protein FtsI (penicillin-binding protein 3)